jgi:hypothetical protein
MHNTETRLIDYKTHILVGVRANGVMTVICDWPHVPSQAEVQEEIDGARDGYVTYALCTPTSVIPAGDDAGGETSARARIGRG